MKKMVVIIIFFILLLTGSRLLWLQLFIQSHQPYAEKGQMDLRDFDFQHRTLTLDGEWLFYPSGWLMDKDNPPTSTTYIQVPDGWDEIFQEDEWTPYGYGSYHLKLLIDPERAFTFSMRVPSIRSAAEIYVDGHLIAAAGELGENRQQTVAKMYRLPLRLKQKDVFEIDIIVQAANFQDPRNGDCTFH